MAPLTKLTQAILPGELQIAPYGILNTVRGFQVTARMLHL